MYFLLNMGIFHCHVSLLEGNIHLNSSSYLKPCEAGLQCFCCSFNLQIYAVSSSGWEKKQIISLNFLKGGVQQPLEKVLLLHSSLISSISMLTTGSNRKNGRRRCRSFSIFEATVFSIKLEARIGAAQQQPEQNVGCQLKLRHLTIFNLPRAQQNLKYVCIIISIYF